jgi:hypothetical protein
LLQNDKAVNRAVEFPTQKDDETNEQKPRKQLAGRKHQQTAHLVGFLSGGNFSTARLESHIAGHAME